MSIATDKARLSQNTTLEGLRRERSGRIGEIIKDNHRETARALFDKMRTASTSNRKPMLLSTMTTLSMNWKHSYDFLLIQVHGLLFPTQGINILVRR